MCECSNEQLLLRHRLAITTKWSIQNIEIETGNITFKATEYLIVIVTADAADGKKTALNELSK